MNPVKQFAKSICILSLSFVAITSSTAIANDGIAPELTKLWDAAQQSMHSKQYANAITLYLQAVDYANSHKDDDWRRSSLYHDLGCAFRNNGDFKKAIQAIRTGLDIAEERRQRPPLDYNSENVDQARVIAEEDLSDAYAADGQFLNAAHCLKTAYNRVPMDHPLKEGESRSQTAIKIGKYFERAHDIVDMKEWNQIAQVQMQTEGVKSKQKAFTYAEDANANSVSQISDVAGKHTEHSGRLIAPGVYLVSAQEGVFNFGSSDVRNFKPTHNVPLIDTWNTDDATGKKLVEVRKQLYGWVMELKTKHRIINVFERTNGGRLTGPIKLEVDPSGFIWKSEYTKNESPNQHKRTAIYIGGKEVAKFNWSFSKNQRCTNLFQIEH